MPAEGKGAPLQRNKLALQRSEVGFRRVVELAPNAIVMIGPTGLIEMVNAQTERVFGYTRDELLGKPIEMLVPERYRPNHPELRKSFFADPVSRPMGAGRDLYGLKKDGSEFPVGRCHWRPFVPVVRPARCFRLQRRHEDFVGER